MRERLASITESRRFQGIVLTVIILNAILVGLETNREWMKAYGSLFHSLNALIQAIFVLEIAIRLMSARPRITGFFRDGWNVFDLIIVSICFLPTGGPFVGVARLGRLLRAMRVVSALPELRLIVSTMLRSIPSLGHVLLLLGLLVYVFAVIGVNLFGAEDPEHWGTLGRAALTLFAVLTLEGWVDFQQAAMAATPLAWVYFVSFVVIASFVVVNLFIAVVLHNLEAVQEQERGEKDRDQTAILQAELAQLRKQLERIEAALVESGEHIRR